jgi:hypothetical protein
MFKKNMLFIIVMIVCSTIQITQGMNENKEQVSENKKNRPTTLKELLECYFETNKGKDINNILASFIKDLFIHIENCILSKRLLKKTFQDMRNIICPKKCARALGCNPLKKQHISQLKEDFTIFNSVFESIKYDLFLNQEINTREINAIILGKKRWIQDVVYQEKKFVPDVEDVYLKDLEALGKSVVKKINTGRSL